MFTLHKRNQAPLLLALCVCFAFLLPAVVAQATVIRTPPGLNLGDMYHLVFVSSTTFGAASSTIGDYDAHVQAAADAGDAALAGITWKAIGSTSLVNAKTHIGVSAPVYLVDGTLVAMGETDLFDGTILTAINKTEKPAVEVHAAVWTGSLSTGLGDAGFELGSGGSVRSGGSDGVGGNWINGAILADSRAFSVYGISEKLTVVPEPSTLILLVVGILGVMGLGYRQRKKAA